MGDAVRSQVLSLAVMLSARRRSPIRFVVAILLALLASVRGGGLALACDLATIEEAHAAAMASHGKPMEHDTPQHGQHGNESCDSPDRVQECAAMAACAPAITTTVDEDALLTAERSITVAIADAPSRVDRSPDPPPPRA
jgi:hypothetical protein